MFRIPLLGKSGILKECVMDKETVKQIIRENQEFPLPPLVERDVEIPLDSSKIITLSGPRRSGKTFLLYSFMKKIVQAKINPEKMFYISFDDPRLLPCTASDLQTISECYFELYPHLYGKMNYAFLDEIQNVKDWELGIRRIYDTGNFRLFLTGSSSKFLSKEIATNLRGRALNFEILPFSFKEFIRAKGIDASVDKNLVYSSKRFGVKKMLAEYFETGSFPEVALEKSENLKVRILKEYLNTMFFRDMIERYRIRNEAVIRELIKYFSTNVGNVFSQNNIWKWLKQTHPLTKKTLIHYSAYLEDIGLFFFLRRFSFSVKEQLQTKRKVYIVDNGLRSAFGFRFSEDRGRILENTVFLELKQRQNRNPFSEIFYYQDHEKREVDFVIKERNRIKNLVQVYTSLQNFETKKREVNSLFSAGKNLKCSNLTVITFEEEGEEKIQGKKIIFKPVWKWLME